MKLKIEKHPQDVILNNYFRRIEALAENMGIDIDDLLQDSEIGSKSMQRHIKKEKLVFHLKLLINEMFIIKIPFIANTVNNTYCLANPFIPLT